MDIIRKQKHIRIFAFVCALLVAFSSIGVNVHVHVCQNSIKAASLLGTAEGCSDLEVPTKCFEHKDNSENRIDREPCCKNLQIFNKSSFENNEVFKPNTQVNTSVLLYPPVVTDLKAVAQLRILILDQNKPPPEKEVIILHQQFLI